jgi:hypothetical protein
MDPLAAGSVSMAAPSLGEAPEALQGINHQAPLLAAPTNMLDPMMLAPQQLQPPAVEYADAGGIVDAQPMEVLASALQAAADAQAQIAAAAHQAATAVIAAAAAQVAANANSGDPGKIAVAPSQQAINPFAHNLTRTSPDTVEWLYVILSLLPLRFRLKCSPPFCVCQQFVIECFYLVRLEPVPTRTFLPPLHLLSHASPPPFVRQ